MLRLLLAVLLLTLPSAALAAGKKPDKDSETVIELAQVGLPITVGGKAVNYVFAEVRLHVAPGQDSMKLRRMEPYYRDALIRAAHRQSFAKAGDWTRVDQARVEAVLLAEARRISGAKAFTKAELKRQTPRRVVGMQRPGAAKPRPAAAKPAPKSLGVARRCVRRPVLASVRADFAGLRPRV